MVSAIARRKSALSNGGFTRLTIKLVLTLPGETRILPGHGEETTVSAIQKKFDSWVNAGPLLRSTDPD